jgi:hypothetical protein
MASRLIAVLTPFTAELPTANAPELRTITVSNIQRPVLAFDASTDETAYWSWIVPPNFTAPLTGVVSYAMASATSGSVRAEGKVEAITQDSDTLDIDAATSFDSTNSVGDTVPGTAGHVGTFTLTLTNYDSAAAGDLARLAFNRDANGDTGTDDATGDMYLLQLALYDDGG